MGITAAESLEKLKEFSADSLKWCAEESEGSTSKITNSVDILLKKTARVSQLSEDSLKAIEEFKSDLDEKLSNTECNLTDLVSNLKKLTHENADTVKGNYAPYYFANVSAVDYFIGKVLDELEKLREGCQSEDLDYLLKPMDMAVEDRMAVELPDTVAEYFRLGQPVMATEVYRKGEEGDIVRVFQKEGAFLGVGVVSDDGRVCPKRLVV